MIVRFRCCNDGREIDTGTKRKRRIRYIKIADEKKKHCNT